MRWKLPNTKRGRSPGSPGPEISTIYDDDREIPPILLSRLVFWSFQIFAVGWYFSYSCSLVGVVIVVMVVVLWCVVISDAFTYSVWIFCLVQLTLKIRKILELPFAKWPTVERQATV